MCRGGSIGTDNCLIYDLKNNNWTITSKFPDSSEGPYGAERMCYTHYKDKIYSIGGNHYPDVGGIYEYDPLTNTWVVLADDLNQYPFQASICKRIGNKWHIFGGNCNGKKTKYCDGDFKGTNKHFVINLDELTLTESKNEFPINIQHPITCDISEKEILVYGGQEENEGLVHKDIYKITILD